MVSSKYILFLISGFLLTSQASGRILSKIEARSELKLAKENGVRLGSFIDTYYCIMKSVSGLNTTLVTGPGHKASYSYGVFQISSDKWCNRWRPGGLCNKHCNDFIDDDIQDDILCAHVIATLEGFQRWSSWVRDCKGKQQFLSNVEEMNQQKRSNIQY